MLGLWRLKRHPIPMQAYFEHCLVLTFALPGELLEPLLPPRLELDRFGTHGFLAVALVSVKNMRPRSVPLFPGLNCTLAGYRVFTRFKTPGGPTWRGLRILRSETNNALIRMGGNLLTHYNYHAAICDYASVNARLHVTSRCDDGMELEVVARTDRAATLLPQGSVFSNFQEARRFAGPLPFTFDYEPQSHSIVSILGRRPDWNPMPVEIEAVRCDFISQFGDAPILSNAFYVHDIPYSWDRGIRFPLSPGKLE